MGDVVRMRTVVQQGFFRDADICTCMGLYSGYAAGYSESEMAYPAEYVIRIFKGNYPRHSFDQSAFSDSSILDVGCGDGRHLVFFDTDLGFEAYGIEPTEELAEIARGNVESAGANATVRAGENRDLPFEDDKFDFLLAWNSSYYMGENHDYDFQTHVEEYHRVLKPGGSIVLSIPKPTSFIYEGSETAKPGYQIVKNDPFGKREGTVLRQFDDVDGIEDAFAPQFEDFTTASVHDDCFGFNYHWWLAIGTNSQ
jgi:SAM-dependent methyltransferase